MDADARELRSTTMLVRVKPSTKAAAIARAIAERRSLSNWVEMLILRAVEKES